MALFLALAPTLSKISPKSDMWRAISNLTNNKINFLFISFQYKFNIEIYTYSIISFFCS